MRVLLRLYSCLFHFVLGLFLFAIGVVTISGGADNLKLDMLPWTGSTLTMAVVVSGLLGMLISVLALLGRLKFLFPLWAAFVVVMMFRGFLFSPYAFGGADGFHDAIWLTVGALLAFACSWAVFRKPKPAF
ncbi:MAG TPA: hypothetical protein VLT57_15840 [Bryobacteraceae bacterium]|nr:hypothetical protein [Bryobacteraceae bacterium]